MYKEDLASNNQQCLICHNTKPNQTKPNPKINHTNLVFKARETTESYGCDIFILITNFFKHGGHIFCVPQFF